MLVSNLGGHSGCKIQLYENEESQAYVKKISSSTAYNDRLIVQAEKQIKYCNSYLKTPKVLKQGYTDENLFYFDMEYIQGITLAEYLKTIEIGKLRNLVDRLVDSIIPRDNAVRISNNEVFLKKILSVKDSLNAITDKSLMDDVWMLLLQHDWSTFYLSSCHGDLTLENIIVKDQDLYLIDFLDSFYDSWILDIGTVLQDVQSLWSYRDQPDISVNTKIRLITFRDILLDKVRSINSNYTIEIYYALLLKLTRIIPYVKDKKTYEFLFDRIQAVLEIIRNEDKQCVL